MTVVAKHISRLGGYFTRKAVVQRVKALPVLQSTIMDIVFKRRVNHPLAKIGRDDLADLAKAMPVVVRGGASLTMGSGILQLDTWEPFQVTLNQPFTAADLNNLLMLDEMGITARLSGIDDKLRRSCRLTAEAMAACSLTGTVSWPVKLEGGGYDVYEIHFGDPLGHIPDTSWGAEGMKLLKAYEDLDDMATAIQEEGYGGVVEFLAGKAAFSALATLVATVLESAKRPPVEARVEGGFIILGGYKVHRMAERYLDPQTNTTAPKVGDNDVVGFATDAQHTMYYCAIDDMEAKLAPLPYFSKIIETRDPSGGKIVGQSKPFPAPVVKAICRATVIFEA